jgi:hypothetical protein
MKKPTAKAIEKEISRLEKMMPTVRPFSAFGDNHHAAIKAQVKVLQEDLSEDDIYDMYDGMDNILSSALEAREWMEGTREDEGSVADDWESLVIKK